MRIELNEFALNCLKYAQKMHSSDIRNDIKDLWSSLTHSRDSELQNYFRSAGSRRAYIGYYFPMYVAKIFLLFERLKKEGVLKDSDIKEMRVWDLGSGTLTGMAALIMSFPDLPFSGIAVDKSLAPMRLGLGLLQQTFEGAKSQKIYLRQANILGPLKAYQSDWSPNIIFLGHVLNEFGDGPRAREKKEQLIEGLIPKLQAGGLLMIVEPATKHTTRHLMALRDLLSQRDDVDVLAPCTGAEECPLLKSPQSWCFSELPWNVPGPLKKIDSEIGFKREALKTSYLVIQKRRPQHLNNKIRIVGGDMKTGSEYRRYLCTPEGLRTLKTKLPTASRLKIDALSRGEIFPNEIAEQEGVHIELES